MHAPAPNVAGHPGIAYVGTWAGKRVVAFAGRAHLYAGHSGAEVTYLVRLAAAAGATTLVLTNAAGALNPAFAPGDLMLIADHINLTSVTDGFPFEGPRPMRSGGSSDAPLDDVAISPFVDMVEAYSPRLRRLAHETSGVPLHEGVYAGVRGPQYETPAEAEALRRLGADAVGMSTVLETIAARRHGLDVLAISVIANAIGPSVSIAHADVLRVARAGRERALDVIAGVLAAL